MESQILLWHIIGPLCKHLPHWQSSLQLDIAWFCFHPNRYYDAANFHANRIISRDIFLSTIRLAEWPVDILQNNLHKSVVQHEYERDTAGPKWTFRCLDCCLLICLCVFLFSISIIACIILYCSVPHLIIGLCILLYYYVLYTCIVLFHISLLVFRRSTCWAERWLHQILCSSQYCTISSHSPRLFEYNIC